MAHEITEKQNKVQSDPNAPTAKDYIPHERLWLRDCSHLSEKWVQALIERDPSILRLGDLVVRDRERRHSRAGRLDLLLQDPESKRRFEVELQLGPTDESHIIRAIEYWDIERKRYPQYDHCCVIVAEDVTSRFLNVISLLNGSVPLVAIQMQLIRVGTQTTLVFTTVLNEITRGLVEEDEDELSTPADRLYWEDRASKETLALVDDLITIAKRVDPAVSAKYLKQYVGISLNEKPFHFMTMRPKKKYLRLTIKLPKTDYVDDKIQASELETMDYSDGYRIRLMRDEIAKQSALLEELMRLAYDARGL
jgi:predicted transport protein